MTGIFAPDVEADRDALVTEDAGHNFVSVPALVVVAGYEDVRIVAVMIKEPRIGGLRNVVRGKVEVAILIVVAAEEVGDVKGPAHREDGGKDVWVSQGSVHCVISTEAAADGSETRGSIELACERDDLVDEIALVLHVARYTPAGRYFAVVPALRIDGIDTEELKVAMFQLVVDNFNHAAVFELEVAPAGSRENKGREASVTEDKNFHVAAQGGGVPLVIFAFHRMSLCRRAGALALLVCCNRSVWERKRTHWTERQNLFCARVWSESGAERPRPMRLRILRAI